MTSARESEDLTRVGPGTPMGALMRQYWIPAALSSELKADGPPMRLMLLGEQLIAFRDSAGRVGIMDHRCPHRCASLFYGRNEEDGIRCVYHGWKFDAEGNCVDIPNLPSDQDFKHKVKARAYKAVERNGLIWAYMGPREEPPPLPAIEPTLLPEDQVRFCLVQRECNWLQALEGDIDTSHFSFLHFGGVDPDDLEAGHMGRHTVTDRAPEYRVEETDWGIMYGAYRTMRPGIHYWRIAHFLFPFWTMPPHGEVADHVWARAWVPMDDHHTMFVELSWTGRTQGLRTLKDGRPIPGTAPHFDYLPDTTDWFGRWRLAANASNDYMIDRDTQRLDSYTGINGILLQDQALTESMGSITDHGFEQLAPSDHMITQTRRRCLRAARALDRDGTVPPGVDDPEICLGARGGDFVAGETESWVEAYADRLRDSADPTGRLHAPE